MNDEVVGQDRMAERATSNRQAGPRRYDLQQRVIDFAVMMIDIVEGLPNSRAGSHIAGQLIRCGTSPAANYGEAQSAESKKDFVHKMKICLKELREAGAWLAIIQRKGFIRSKEKLSKVAGECNELTAIFVCSVATAEGRKRKQDETDTAGRA